MNASPAEVADQLSTQEGLIWLDSALTEGSGNSLITACPTELIQGNIQDDWTQIETRLSQGISARSPGGLFGWVGFDGQFTFGHYPQVLRYHHDQQQWSEVGHLSQQLQAPTQPKAEIAKLTFVPQVSKQAYTQAVRQAQEYISAGDIYQVNLALPWHADWPEQADALAYYRRLRQISPAPHAAFVRMADTTILSASPELFLKIQGRKITTRPIKGTRPRFPNDPIRDAASASELPLCEKERAELLMITDLERNDLGQVCEFGSVHTPDLWRVESFAQVYHLVSTVTGLLKPGISQPRAFRACFPGGSISGAPKKRALEIIAELEAHPRGLYTGAIGYFGFDSSSQWSIAIRTAIIQNNQISFHTGSGIVADSIPEKEWEETHHKASGLLSAWT
jgi:para-aminobenzoate synthetase component 1